MGNQPSSRRTRGEHRGGQRGNTRGKSEAQRQAARLTNKRAMDALAEVRAEQENLERWLAAVAERERASLSFAAGLAAPGPWETGMGEAECRRLREDIIRRSRWDLGDAVRLASEGYSLTQVARLSGWDVIDVAKAIRGTRERGRLSS